MANSKPASVNPDPSTLTPIEGTPLFTMPTPNSKFGGKTIVIPRRQQGANGEQYFTVADFLIREVLPYLRELTPHVVSAAQLAAMRAQQENAQLKAELARVRAQMVPQAPSSDFPF